MKKNLLFLLFLLAALSVIAQKNKPKANAPVNYTISLTPEKWQYATGTAEFYEKEGIKMMHLRDTKEPVFLRDYIFKDGTIEMDFLPVSPMSIRTCPSIYFRGDKQNYFTEIFYIRARPDNPFANDAIQYAPILDRVNMWDMYPEFQAPTLFASDKTNHLKMIISGQQMQVYINDMKRPALHIPRLEGKTKEGSFALGGNVIISNLQIKPGVVEDLPAFAAPDLTDHDANYIRSWSMTKPTDLPLGIEVGNQNIPKLTEFTDSIWAERRGLINLTRKIGGNFSRKVIWLKATIKSAEARSNVMQLGFSDEVWVFVNNQLVFLDKNLYMIPPMRKYPDGRISIQNARLGFNLTKGDNELLIAVANDFYGWGIIARLEAMEGISF